MGLNMATAAQASTKITEIPIILQNCPQTRATAKVEGILRTEDLIPVILKIRDIAVGIGKNNGRIAISSKSKPEFLAPDLIFLSLGKIDVKYRAGSQDLAIYANDLVAEGFCKMLIKEIDTSFLRQR